MITVVGNLKGGTGKSTVVFNLAIWLEYQGKPVRLFDLDPQGTLTDTIEVRNEELYEPALRVQNKLPSRIKGEAFVDVGTSDMEALHAALARADRIIMPVTPSQADVWSTQRFIGIIREATKRRKTKPELIAFINRADTHHMTRENDETLDALTQIEGVAILTPRLSQRIDFRRSFSEGLSVFELNPSGKAAAEIDALAIALVSPRKQKKTKKKKTKKNKKQR